jgi:hypothetical protein
MKVVNKVDFDLSEYFQVFLIDRSNQVIELNKKKEMFIKYKLV